MLTDWMFVCPTRRLARAFAKLSPKRTFLYTFEHVVDSSRLGLAQNYGSFAYHAAELPFVFACSPAGQSCITPAGEKNLSDAMVLYWRSFAASGQPLGPTDWPPAGEDGNTILAFDVALEHGGGGTWSRNTGARQRPGICDQWEEAASVII